ncbi:MAG: hypothetical protein ACREJ2_11230 [Planctomycetota bacterium]
MTPAPDNLSPTGTRADFHRGMFDLQASYLHHRLRREPWWGLDYAFGNFSTFKSVCRLAPGVNMDLDDHGWRRQLAATWSFFETHREPSDREAFVEHLRADWLTRWLAAYPIFEKHLNEERYIGCFRYDFNPEKRVVHLHFQNTVAPASPFANLEERRADLAAILQEIRTLAATAGHATPDTVHFDSWMNALDPIKKLFPAEFRVTPSEEFPKGYGWWGQFIAKDGGLNARRAQAFIETGKFEFPRQNGQCSWQAFIAQVPPNPA